MRISDWSSDVCSSDLRILALTVHGGEVELGLYLDTHRRHRAAGRRLEIFRRVEHRLRRDAADVEAGAAQRLAPFGARGDRKGVVWGKRGSVRVDLGGRGINKKKNNE